MRITGGRYSGRTVLVPPGTIRPAMDRMRESLFSILGDLSGFSFLDLFSGSGIMALEASSRGAAPITLVERDRQKRATIERNIRISEEQVRIVIAPVERFVASNRGRWSVVFVDPPFAYKHKTDLLERIAAAGLVSPSGRLLMHLPSRENLPGAVGDLTRTDGRRYGGSSVVFYERLATPRGQTPEPSV